MLYELSSITEGTVIKRPSQSIKTPYVADICIDGQYCLGHTPALGCGGLADKGALVYMTKSTSVKAKCNYTFYLSKYIDADHPNDHELVGINPKLAETLIENAIQQNLLSRLLNVLSYRRETSIVVEQYGLHSRFDFSGIDKDGCPFLLEIKNVPLADYEDIYAKDRVGKCYKDRDFRSKVAYFPDGYRKKITDTISPRALKHVQELTKIKSISKTRCLMGFVIQRSDVTSFQASMIDPEYRAAVRDAIAAGVEVFAMVVKWSLDGSCTFVSDDLPIGCM